MFLFYQLTLYVVLLTIADDDELSVLNGLNCLNASADVIKTCSLVLTFHYASADISNSLTRCVCDSEECTQTKFVNSGIISVTTITNVVFVRTIGLTATVDDTSELDIGISTSYGIT